MVGYLSFVLGIIGATIGLILVGPWLACVALWVGGLAALLIAGMIALLRAAIGLFVRCGPWLLLVIAGVVGLLMPLAGRGSTVYVVDTGIAYHKTLPNVKQKS